MTLLLVRIDPAVPHTRTKTEGTDSTCSVDISWIKAIGIESFFKPLILYIQQSFTPFYYEFSILSVNKAELARKIWKLWKDHPFPGSIFNSCSQWTDYPT